MSVQVSKLLRFPRRTVRVRLTVLYASLFLACGAVLLALTDLMMARLIHGSEAIRLTELMRVVNSAKVHDSIQAARLASRLPSDPAHLVQAETTRGLQQQAVTDLNRMLFVSGIA